MLNQNWGLYNSVIVVKRLECMYKIGLYNSVIVVK
jgi:hypothetical protein